MELDDLDKEIEWESRRVAAAFEVETFECLYLGQYEGHFQGRSGTILVTWFIDVAGPINPQLRRVELGDWANEEDDLYCNASLDFAPEGEFWKIAFCCAHNQLMARGLCRLGIEEECVFVQLDLPLTAHEKLEFCLSMPREFWPQKWLDEESVGADV